MSELKIAVRKQPAQYEPGEEITGAAQWVLKHPPKGVEVRLLWHTRGRGIADVAVAATLEFESPLQEDTRPFTLVAPDAPYSFSGQLITLEWALELVALPSRENARIGIVIAPGGVAVDLQKSASAEISG